MKMLFYRDMLKRHQISTSTTKNKQAKAIYLFFINQITLANIHVKTPPICKVGLGKIFLVACNLYVVQN